MITIICVIMVSIFILLFGYVIYNIGYHNGLLRAFNIFDNIYDEMENENEEF